ncbi:MAG: DUF1330 domain-containing protein [Gammaproteobacteria bacterium]|nr:DUF1330 domain-containing protein [Gammaproteobacteria bacterium]MCY4357873.1 DUF1330 domain-containing protein [Gammaproteobacteria bacterium]
MPSYVIANHNITNAEGYQEYSAKVGATIEAYGCKVLVAGTGATSMEGNAGEVTVVLEFPSREALQAWYNSPEYQEIINLRKNSTKGFLVFADQFVMPT